LSGHLATQIEVIPKFLPVAIDQVEVEAGVELTVRHT